MPTPPHIPAGEGLVQEEASPAKSSEGQEGNEEEQDLDELDPVALHKKVRCVEFTIILFR